MKPVRDRNALAHYGVKGMKWGVRRTPEQIRHDLDKQKAKKQATIIEDYIHAGKVIVEINAQKQLRHIKSSPEYIKGRSYLYGDLESAKTLVSDLAMTGEPIILKESNWTYKEKVASSRPIGVYVDNDTHKRHKTNEAMVVYSKTGTHIYPKKPSNGG